MVDLQGKSRAELEQLIADAQVALERMTVVWELRERFDWQVREFERLAAVQGPVPAEPVPEGGFMPGQVVDADGTLYLNGSVAFITYAPGDEPLSQWVAVTEPPEPGDPEPEPTPPAPDAPAWEQPIGYENTYNLGDQVTHDGHLWESTVDGNAWEPPTGWDNLGPVSTP